MKRSIIQSVLTLCFASVTTFTAAQSTATYQPDNRNVANPERGFYTQQWQFPGDRLSVDYLRSLREQENVTLIRIPFRVPNFRNKPFNQEVLQTVEAAFNAARQAGMKVIPRVAYSYGQDEPDAPLAVVLQHIKQLKPLLRKHADVIAFMNAGFIGAWGEWHSSSNGLADDNAARRTILFALLDALPPERMVNLRYNYHKREIFGTDQPLTESEAFRGSRRARTGGLNDCFRASFYDLGTYTWQGDIEAEKDYLRQDNRFVPQSGETCGQSEYSDCVTSLKDLKRMRWDALNRDFDETVLNDWKDQGCYPSVSKKLGYHLVLQRTTVATPSLAAGQLLKATIQLRNEGWGKAYNPRDVELILRHQSSGKLVKIPLDQDPRRWLIDDGVITLALEEKLPDNVADGPYELLLNLPDPAPSLAGRPEYSIRMANQGTWESSTGFNQLKVTVTVGAPSSPTAGSGMGLSYALYNNRSLSGSPLNTGKDATVNFDGQKGGKAPGLPQDNFSVRWTGQVQPRYSEPYTFYTRADDGTRLWVNGQLLVDDWTDHAVRERSGRITLQAGKKYDIKLEYYENKGRALCQLRWSSPRQAKQIIPKARLYPKNRSNQARRSDSPTKERRANEPSAVRIYPNPSTNGQVSVAGVPAGSQVRLYTLRGQRVPLHPPVTVAETLQVRPQRAMSPGLYLLWVRTAEGDLTQHRLLVAPPTTDR